MPDAPLINELPRTKVVATVGPACSSPVMLRAVALAGVSVFRLNFSHGDHATHAEAVKNIRHAAEEIGRPLAILGDLCGPKLRIGTVPGGQVTVEKGERITLTSKPVAEGETRRFQVSFPDLERSVKVGGTIAMDDGMVRFRIEKIVGEDVVCSVQNHNPVAIKSRKGVNLPGARLSIPALTEKDRVDLKFAIEQGVDYVALSFVRSPEDIKLAKDAMWKCGKIIPLIAKIEKSEALDHLDSILAQADGAMVARGDLGVEIPVQEVPSAQIRIIRACNRLTKPVITATQMLNSMIEAPIPTRAEVTDIYNAVQDGTDAVMLSAETAAGNYPVESVRMMNEVALQAEKDLNWSRELSWVHAPEGTPHVAEAICEAAVTLAESLKLDAIVCPTQSGTTALRVARFRPRCRLLSFSTDERTVNKLCLVWGVQSHIIRELSVAEEEVGATDALVESAIRTAKNAGFLRAGQRVVVLAGLPLRVPGRTNFMRVVDVEADERVPFSNAL